MRFGTSCSNLTLYRKTVNRFWPLWAVNLVFWLFLLPLNGLMQLGDDPYGSAKSLERFARNVGDYATDLGVVFAALAGLAVAMAVCSHMYNNRSANFMGSLPARREGQFLSTYLAGLTILIAPNVLIFLLTLLVETVGGAVLWIPLLFWLGTLCAMEFFFYSFAVCLGQFTGHILALPVFYGVFNVIVAAVYTMIQWVMEEYYFGYAGIDLYSGLILWFTPVAALLQMDVDVIQDGTVWITSVEGLWIAGVYAAAAVVLTVCALLLYRRRHLETAGDIVAVKVMRPVFRYGVGFCAGMFLGWLTDQLLNLEDAGMLIAVVIWGVVGCFVAQMLLEKTVRVFKKWKGCAALAAVFVIIFAIIGFDLTGYESRVPAAAAVESVEIRGLSGYPWDSGSNLQVTVSDPLIIADAVELHQAIVELGENGEAQDGYEWMTYQVSYRLKSGKTLTRHYNVRAGEILLTLAQNIRDREEVRRQAYGIDDLENFLALGGKLEWVQVYSDEKEEVRLYPEAGELLWAAVMRDFAAGDIGIHCLGDFEGLLEEKFGLIMVGDGVRSNLSLEFKWMRLENGRERSFHLQIMVGEDAANTKAVLSQLLMPDNRYQDDPNDNPLWRSEG